MAKSGAATGPPQAFQCRLGCHCREPSLTQNFKTPSSHGFPLILLAVTPRCPCRIPGASYGTGSGIWESFSASPPISLAQATTPVPRVRHMDKQSRFQVRCRRWAVCAVPVDKHTSLPREPCAGCCRVLSDGAQARLVGGQTQTHVHWHAA